MQSFTRFGIAGLCFLGFAVAVSTLSPAINVANDADDWASYPWVGPEATIGETSYALAGEQAGRGVDSEDGYAALMIPPGLEVNWKAPRSSGRETPTFADIQAPGLFDEPSDLSTGSAVNGSARMSAEYAADSCRLVPTVCFGGISEGLRSTSRQKGSVLNDAPGPSGDFRGWNRLGNSLSDPGPGGACGPLKKACANVIGASRTPEPSEIILLGMGLIALAMASRKRLFA